MNVQTWEKTQLSRRKLKTTRKTPDLWVLRFWREQHGLMLCFCAAPCKLHILSCSTQKSTAANQRSRWTDSFFFFLFYATEIEYTHRHTSFHFKGCGPMDACSGFTGFVLTPHAIPFLDFNGKPAEWNSVCWPSASRLAETGFCWGRSPPPPPPLTRTCDGFDMLAQREEGWCYRFGTLVDVVLIVAHPSPCRDLITPK